MKYEEKTRKIRSFNDLVAWQEAHILVVLIYQCTREFPNDERFSLTNQLRRAVISVTSNIAEGFGRQSPKEKVQFYYLANGSLLEVKSQLFAAKDLQYITQGVFNDTMEQADRAQSILRGLIRSCPNLSHPSSS